MRHRALTGPFDFAQAIFLDSGGYEASKDVELSDMRLGDHIPASWTLDDYRAIVESWKSSRPTVVISYDHPDERLPTPEQIDRADQTLPRRPGIFREILFKPETADENEMVADSGTADKTVRASANFCKPFESLQLKRDLGHK